MDNDRASAVAVETPGEVGWFLLPIPKRWPMVSNIAAMDGT